MNSEDKRPVGKRDDLMRDTLMNELKLVDATDGGTAKNFQLIARALIQEAKAGDVRAIKEIHDRIDGKSAPRVAGPSETPRKVFIEWKLPSEPTTSPDGSSLLSTTEPPDSPAS